MATRIDKKVSQNLDIANNYSALQSYLMRRAGRKLNDINYVGLLRNNALSDLDDPGEALTNVLEYITRVDDASEIAVYGTYKPEDFEITREFVENEITTSFLTPLTDISVAGGVAGAVVSTNPRIRVEDRIDQINSFTGKGTFNGLHAGPTAIFYKVRSGVDQEFGTLKFTTLNENTGIITVSPANIVVNADQLSSYNSQLATPNTLVWTLKSYINPSTNREVSLVGTGVTIKSVVTGSSIVGGQVVYTRQLQTTDGNSLDKLKELKNIIGANFLQTVYKFSREYSALNPPKWFLESPNSSGGAVAYSADDINPLTTQSVLEFKDGAFRLYSEKEYFNSGAYVETRVVPEDRDVYEGNNITKDSNMRFSKPPRVLRDNQNNWGVRWDGYLRLDNNGTDTKFIFELETNTAIKIDVVNGGTNSQPQWAEVFNSFDSEQNAKFITEGDRYISKTSFNLDNLPSKFIHKTNSLGSTGYRYVPISIRMWNGGLDRGNDAFEVPLEPNLFIKVGTSDTSPNTVDTFYSGDISVIVSETGPNKIVTPDPNSDIDLLAILSDSTSSVTYSLIAFEETITRVIGQNPDGSVIEETISISVPFSPSETISLSVVSNVIYATALPSRGSGDYILRVTPNRSNYSRSVLWSSKLVSPKDDYNGYQDLTSGVFEPSIYKYEFDLRPQWWKVSEGNRYLFDQPISKTNDPLDGFVDNAFKGTLKSLAEGIGKYGNGSGVYTDRPNLILGESKYTGDTDSSNYIGMRLTANLLGEGGIVKFTGIPVNNALFDSIDALGANDLGGSPNNKTISGTRIAPRVVNMNWNALTSRFYLYSNLTTITVSDDPTLYGFPAFTSESDWAKPIIVNATSNADNLAFTTNVQGFTAPLVLNVERIKYNTSTDLFGSDNNAPLGTNEIWLLAFSTTFAPAQTSLNGKFVRYFLESDIAFQFANVDTGESVSFADVLKMTYMYDASGTSSVVNSTTSSFTGAYVSGGTGAPTTLPQFTVVVSATGGITTTVTNPGQNVTSGMVFKVPTTGAAAALTNLGVNFRLTFSFVSSLSEVPKVPSERVTPFGYDIPSSYTNGVCYPPYDISDVLLKDIARTDSSLYNTTLSPIGNYDVIWGDHTKPEIGGNKLNISEKIEFSYSITDNPVNIITTSSKSLNNLDYTHRVKVELPIFKSDGTSFDEDVYEHIGNQEKVKDTYYLFVNARSNPTNSSTGLLPGIG